MLRVEDASLAGLKIVSYSAAHDRGLAWDDPTLAIAWPAPAEQVILSGKDREHPRLRDLPPIFT